MEPDKLKEHFIELIRRTSCELAPDVQSSLEKAAASEQGRARSTLDLILDNVREAKEKSIPICQDTGSILFNVEHGPDFEPKLLQTAIFKAVVQATQASYLRPNAVHPITGKNSGDNTGIGAPNVHFKPIEKEKHLSVRLMLKGGGSENCGAQYTLPDQSIQAARDVTGIKRCILDAVLRAQGFGCAPGIIGVGIGGDRVTSLQESKEQFYRRLDDENPDPVLLEIEHEMLAKLNQLGIGPMGFGGATTCLGVKLGVRHRHPASFFVSVSYTCWAYRRRRMEIDGDQVKYS